jgi:hypothetical protein
MTIEDSLKRRLAVSLERAGENAIQKWLLHSEQTLHGRPRLAHQDPFGTRKFQGTRCAMSMQIVCGFYAQLVRFCASRRRFSSWRASGSFGDKCLLIKAVNYHNSAEIEQAVIGSADRGEGMGTGGGRSSDKAESWKTIGCRQRASWELGSPRGRARRRGLMETAGAALGGQRPLAERQEPEG